jgi:hypothetical protein
MRREYYIKKIYINYWKGLLSREESKIMLTEDSWLSVQIRKKLENEKEKTVSPTTK